ncbi:MAG: dihydropteroate synthase [Candidatus Omnitrophica bacterium]|nr:dihydropteroate synthase [Candidatus Omnitrophota bacterium]
MYWKIKHQQIQLDRPLVMGIVNVTPDSFSEDGSLYMNPDRAADYARRLADEGAGILDIGGESTRPGAKPVTADQELARILPVLRKITPHIKQPISIDTTKAEVARVCLEEGAQIINDVSGLKVSGHAMANVVEHYEAGFVLMHRRGTPETMQAMTYYADVISEIIDELRLSIEFAEAMGIKRGQIVIDPGLGFAKEPEHNFQIIRELEKFQRLDCPVLIGASRKSFIGKVTGRNTGEREFGTAAMNAVALINGAHILRVHNVKAACDVLRVVHAIFDRTACVG